MSVFDIASTLWWNRAGPDVIAQRTAARLRRLVTYAGAKVPYYRELFSKAGISPQDIQTPADLVRIPITTRDDVQSRPFTDFLEEGGDHGALRDFTTSGSTGRPLIVRQCRDDQRINQALLFRTLWRYGMRPWHSKMSVAASDPLPVDRSLLGKLGLFRRVWISARWPADRWVIELRKARPGVLFGYCLTWRLAARALRERGITDVRPQFVVTTSGVLDAATREELETSFQCPVRDVYASWEGGIMAWECAPCGGYHVNADWVVLEVLKDGQPVQPGEEGEVVITNLHSMGMPFIRYRQGDLVATHPGSPSCGCSLPLIRRISGRVADMIILPSGQQASPHAFIAVVDKVAGLKQWRLIQKGKARFRLEAVAGPDFGVESEEAIRKGLFNLVGRPVAVEIVRVESLPDNGSGKHRFVISEVSA